MYICILLVAIFFFKFYINKVVATLICRQCGDFKAILVLCYQIQIKNNKLKDLYHANFPKNCRQIRDLFASIMLNDLLFSHFSPQILLALLAQVRPDFNGYRLLF